MSNRPLPPPVSCSTALKPRSSETCPKPIRVLRSANKQTNKQTKTLAWQPPAPAMVLVLMAWLSRLVGITCWRALQADGGFAGRGDACSSNRGKGERLSPPQASPTHLKHAAGGGEQAVARPQQGAAQGKGAGHRKRMHIAHKAGACGVAGGGATVGRGKAAASPRAPARPEARPCALHQGRSTASQR